MKASYRESIGVICGHVPSIVNLIWDAIWPLVGKLDVLTVNNLISPHWLAVGEMIGGIVEFRNFRELNRVQCPHYDCFPHFELILSLLTAAL